MYIYGQIEKGDVSKHGDKPLRGISFCFACNINDLEKCNTSIDLRPVSENGYTNKALQALFSGSSSKPFSFLSLVSGAGVQTGHLVSGYAVC